MSFDQDSSMPNGSIPHFDSPYPNITISDDSTPTQQQVFFTPNDWTFDAFPLEPMSSSMPNETNLSHTNPFLANPTHVNTPLTNASVAYGSSQSQMHMHSSSFSLHNQAAHSATARVVAPQHAAPHAAPLSFSEHDRRYWQGFEDGLKAQLMPTVSSNLLSPSLSRSFFGNGSGTDHAQPINNSSDLIPDMFTAPTTPLDSVFGQETGPIVKSESSQVQQINESHANLARIVASLTESAKINNEQINKLANSVKQLHQVAQAQYLQVMQVRAELARQNQY